MSLGPRLQGRVALVTGGCSGMGRSTVALFILHGAKVAILDRQDPIDPLPEGAVLFKGSVIVEEDWEGAFRLAEKTFGETVTILINCAGVLGPTKIHEVKNEEWDRTLAINTTGPYLGMKIFIKKLLDKQVAGSIVNIASIAGVRGMGCGISYEASKAALVQMTKSAGVDYAKNGIRTNCVLPGMTSTEMTTKNTGVALEQFSPFISRVPINRWSTPGEVSNAILFLASDESSYITGAILAHDGGYTAA